MRHSICMTEDIISIDDFQTDTAALLRRPQKTGRPLIITEHGRPTAIIITPAQFDTFSQQQRASSPPASPKSARAETTIDRVPETTDNLEAVKAIGPENWLALSHWAKETNSLEAGQRSLAYKLGKLLGRGEDPSLKQAAYAIKVLRLAHQLGFELRA